MAQEEDARKNTGVKPDVPDEPQMCCRAMTSSCLACSAGMTEDSYCEKNPSTPGCPKKDDSTDKVQDHDQSKPDTGTDSKWPSCDST